MKIIALNAPLETASNLAFSCLPDSAILRNNDDFYLPNFSSQIQAVAGFYCSFHKIGKHIETQFVPRYIKEIGVAINFIAADTRLSLHAAQLPTDIAQGFDHSFATSNHAIPFSQSAEQLHIRFDYNNQPLFNTNIAPLLSNLYCAIAQASEYFTYKIGDVFFVPLQQISSVNANDMFDAYIDEKHFLSCKVR